jgi:uncharacterized protein
MKFLVTRELGRLAKWLRILGYDAEYFKAGNLSSLLIQSLAEDRLIVTRNRHLPQSRSRKIIFISGQDLKAQIAEFLKQLKQPLNCDMMFRRCTLCNAALLPAPKDEVKNRVPDYIFSHHDSFLTCPVCKRVYWLGTHWGNVQKTLQELSL